MPISKQKPIFIHSLFRTGSTYLFNVFRRSASHYWCYHEPFNEQLAHLNGDSDRLIEMKTELGASLRHPEMDRPYFWEYHQVRSALRGMFEKSFSYDDFFVDDANRLAAGQSRYLDRLISSARGRPVLEFCRSAGRLSALSNRYDSVNIHLWRAPRDQWWSFKINDYFDAAMQLIYGAHHLPTVLRQVKRQCGIAGYHDENVEKEFEFARKHPLGAESGYFAFYALWLYAFLESVKYSDITININRLTCDAEYRLESMENFSRLEIDHIDISDCSMPQHRYADTEIDFYEEIEARAKQSFLACGYNEDLLEEATEEQRCAGETINAAPGEIMNSLLRARQTAMRYFDQTAETATIRNAHASRIEVLEKELHDRNKVIEALNDELQTVYTSKSWSITLPLRMAMQFATRFFQPASTVSSFTLLFPGSIAKRLLLSAMEVFASNRRFKAIGLHVLNKFPKIKATLRMVAIRINVVVPYYPVDEKSLLRDPRSRAIVKSFNAEVIRYRQYSGLLAKTRYKDI